MKWLSMSENTTQTDGGNTNSSNQRPASGIDALRIHVIQNKIDVCLCATRVLTIVFAIFYLFLPIFGNFQNAYYMVLIANAATSALRLHQRFNSKKGSSAVQFPTEFLSLLLMEDSCHYLFFSLIFLYVSPVLLILLPVVIFAVLHTSSYSLTLLDLMGQNFWWAARQVISVVELQRGNMLRLAAFTEVFLMPIAIVMVFLERAGFMTPFIYYQFLILRYSSSGNSHTRNIFEELSLGTETISKHPSIPGVISKILQSGIAFISKLDPQPVQQQAQQ